MKTLLKLVRDLIPYRFPRSQSRMYACLKHDKELYQEALEDKLVEEVCEVIAAPDKANLTEELADVLEVLMAKAKAHDISWVDVIRTGHHKRNKYGGFEEGYYLITLRPFK